MCKRDVQTGCMSSVYSVDIINAVHPQKGQDFLNDYLLNN